MRNPEASSGSGELVVASNSPTGICPNHLVCLKNSIFIKKHQLLKLQNEQR